MFELLQYTFMRNALYAGILGSIIFGIIGTYVVVKKIVFISGGVAHASFGGVGMSLYLGIEPLLGALLFAITSALGVGFLGRKKIQREDTAIGIIWALGMAIGAFFYHITPGYLTSPASFLFGNLLMIGTFDIYLLGGLALAIVIIVVLFYHRLQAVSFDEEFSEVVGIKTNLVYILLLIMIAFSIVFLIKFVGIILVIAMLSIPASISSSATHDMRKVMVYSVILSLVFILSGLWLSYQWNTPAGPTIILLSGAVFILNTVGDKLSDSGLSFR